MFQKDMRLSLLLDFYGDILSERRRELIALYYTFRDWENTGISRQGVRDSIKKSEQELLRLEETLALATRFESLQKQLADICKDLNALSEEHSDMRDALMKITQKLEKLSI